MRFFDESLFQLLAFIQKGRYYRYELNQVVALAKEHIACNLLWEVSLFIKAWRKSIKLRNLIHCTLFTDLRSFSNTIGNPIDLVLLENYGRVEHQYNFFNKKIKNETEINDDENFQLFM